MLIVIISTLCNNKKMDIYSFLDERLSLFRKHFHREKTFRWFIFMVLSFMLRNDKAGITSAVRAFCLDNKCYESLIKFFRSNAYSTKDLRKEWISITMSSPLCKTVNNRCVLIGDGVKQSKEAFYMPGIKKLHQESENSGKAEYIFGHMFGAVGVLLCNKLQAFCAPLSMDIHDGLRAASNWENSTVSSNTHVEQMIIDAFRAAEALQTSAYFTADRYFFTSAALKKLAERNKESGGQLVELITKAKKNCVAYEEPLPKAPGKRGRPRIKGEQVKLKSLFENADAFQTTKVSIYGKEEDVRYLATDLLWKQQTGIYQKVRFVLVNWKGRKEILVSTDLTISAETIIELYAYRFKIECTFREFKQQIGGFGYHFWTKSLDKLDKFKKKGSPDPIESIIDERRQQCILKTYEAIERYVLLAVIAMGLIQMMILQVDNPEEIQRIRYQRTIRPGRLSEATLMEFLRRTFLCGLFARPEKSISPIILNLLLESYDRRVTAK